MRDVAMEVIINHPAEFALAALVGAHQSLIEVWGALTVPGAVWNIALLIAAAFRTLVAHLSTPLAGGDFSDSAPPVFRHRHGTRLHHLHGHPRPRNHHALAGCDGCLRRHASAQPAKSGVGVPFTPG